MAEERFIVAVTGEGASDIGKLRYGETSPFIFEKGFMCAIIEALIRRMSNGSIEPRFAFLSESELTQNKKVQPRNRRRFISNRLSNVFVETPKYPELYYRAETFSQWASGYQATLAILFTDADGTRRETRGQAEDKEKSILLGFKNAKWEIKGIPMVPQPKSEAWLLAYYQKDKKGKRIPYLNCERFELLSGNDDAKPQNNAKMLLDTYISQDEISYEELLTVEWHRVSMPSLNRFRERLRVALSL